MNDRRCSIHLTAKNNFTKFWIQGNKHLMRKPTPKLKGNYAATIDIIKALVENNDIAI